MVEPSDQVAVSLAHERGLLLQRPGAHLHPNDPVYFCDPFSAGHHVRCQPVRFTGLRTPTGAADSMSPTCRARACPCPPRSPEAPGWESLPANPTSSIPITSRSIPAAFPSSRTAWSPEASASPAPTPPRRSMPPYAGTVLNGFAPMVPAPGAVIVNGIALPFVVQTTIPAGESPGSADGSYELCGPRPAPAPRRRAT